MLFMFTHIEWKWHRMFMALFESSYSMSWSLLAMLLYSGYDMNDLRLVKYIEFERLQCTVQYMGDVPHFSPTDSLFVFFPVNSAASRLTTPYTVQ